MKSYKNKTQKLYSMKGCSRLGKYKKGGVKKMRWGTQKGGCGCGSSTMTGGRRRRHKKMLAYPASNSQAQAQFTKGVLAYSGQNGGLNANLPYGQVPPSNNEFPPGVSQPQNLRGGEVINEAVVYGPINNYGGRRRRKGGNSGRWPDGLVGSPWSSNSLPGANGISGDRNYLAYNNYKYDPQTQGVINGRAMSGGRKTRKNLRGGGLIPNDLVNIGRQMMFGVNSAYNALAGNPSPVNPLPYKDQFSRTPMH